MPVGATAFPCQVTSKSYGDARAIAIGESELASGSLRVESFARPGKLFTANETLVSSTVATLAPVAVSRVIEAVVEVLRSGVALAAGNEEGSPGGTHRR
jgi:mRNA interferase MazF